MQKPFHRASLLLVALIGAGLLGKPSAAYAQSTTVVPFWKKIGKFSWGPLRPVLPQSCDGDGGIAGRAAGSLVRSLIGAVDGFVEKSMVMDDVLIAEGLQDQFKIIADVGMPVVWVVDRNSDEIVFAYSLGLVFHDEVSSAARKYCGYDKKKSVYEGSSRHCTPMRDMKNMHITYVISAFNCAS